MDGLISYVESGAATTVRLPREFVTIGSGLGASLRIAMPGVLPTHAGLAWSARLATWELSRLQPDSVAEVNGQPVAADRPMPLGDLDEIKLGPLLLQFRKEPAAPMLRGKPCDSVRLSQAPLVIGRQTSSEGEEGARWELDAEDGGLSREHASIEWRDGSYILTDQSKTGTELNGRTFTSRPLVYGDRFRIRDYFFEFTGDGVRRVPADSGGCVELRQATFTLPEPAGGRTLIHPTTLRIASGDFVGILGGSGQGKSTLLNLMSGHLVPTGGETLLDGIPPSAMGEHRLPIGFVPQEDIVHPLLTVRQALRYSALLKLNITPEALETLVSGVMERLGLTRVADARIDLLSGGERKRVSIGTELLTRPSILFLDEPSSGLDPASEEDLMTTLQNLSLTGQTVICTTHVLQKAYLFKRICFIHDGRLLYSGKPEEARNWFLKRDESATVSTARGAPLERIYGLFVRGHEAAEEWEHRFQDSPKSWRPDAATPSVPRSRPAQSEEAAGLVQVFSVLIERQWRLLMADRRNWQFLLIQALSIGFLIGIMGHDPALRWFLAMIAAVWFGCGNAAQQIVGERRIFERERLCGLSVPTYLTAKLVFFGLVSVIQTGVLVADMWLISWLMDDGEGLAPPASDGWALAARAVAMAGAALIGSSLGLWVSSRARNALQAVMWVPLIVIPQILFAGFVVPVPQMPPVVRRGAHAAPSFHLQRLLDFSFVHGLQVPREFGRTRHPVFLTDLSKEKDNDPETRHAFGTAWENLVTEADEPEGKDWAYVNKNGVAYSDRPNFEDPRPAWCSIAGILMWISLASLAAWHSLHRRAPQWK